MEKESSEQINYGFLPSKIEPDHYVLGGSELPKIVLMPLGNWERYLPVEERQFQWNVETANCTGFGTLSAIETLLKRLYNI